MTRYTRDTIIKDIDFDQCGQRIRTACHYARPPLVTLGDIMNAGKNRVMREEGMGNKSWAAIERVLAEVSDDPDIAGEYKELYF